MLNVYFGDMPDAIYNTNIYFNNTYKDSWITKPLSRDIIQAVDHSEVIDEKPITIVRGDSGTGKTTLYDMIADFTRLHEASGVNISQL